MALLLVSGKDAKSQAYDGLTLFQPNNSSTAYLINMDGSVHHSWVGPASPGLSVYLLPDGDLLRTLRVGTGPGGTGGAVERVSWDGVLEWQFEYNQPNQYLQHHDIELLPNGNILMVAWDYRPQAEAVAEGRNPNTISGGQILSDSIIEVQPTGPNSGQIVWAWYAWDHLIQDFDSSANNYGVVGDHPELIDLNYPPGVGGGGGGPGGGGNGTDWLHLNSVDYNAELDQIVVSVHNTDEIWVIDHSTTMEEAAGHTGGNSGKGGDLLYRWGNPAAYDQGTAGDQELFGQHDAQWITDELPGAGDILIFNNGLGAPGPNASSVDQITPPVDGSGSYAYTPGTAYGPTSLSWQYIAPNPTTFYSQNISGCQRLPNGNTLICSGRQGWFFEVTAAGQLVWEYTYSSGGGSNNVFRANRYRLCDSPTVYCQAGPNSNGAGAMIGYSGTNSVSANDLVLEILSAAVNKPGIFYYGPNQIQAPFGDGYRCVGGAVKRLPVVFTDSFGDASFAIDLTSATLPTGTIAEGDIWNFQFWYRDPPGTLSTFNLSDALSVPFCP
ncbi:MAG: aryl-sulfate sulfotransferase [Planctomycetes bacterium]|nr:aryl-sulfate sulfotransferase [Planctomycetota bacterium]